MLTRALGFGRERLDGGARSARYGRLGEVRLARLLVGGMTVLIEVTHQVSRPKTADCIASVILQTPSPTQHHHIHTHTGTAENQTSPPSSKLHRSYSHLFKEASLATIPRFPHHHSNPAFCALAYLKRDYSYGVAEYRTADAGAGPL